MRPPSLSGTAAVVVAIAVLGAATKPASACCAAYPADMPIGIGEQAILIVWDAAHRTEHFVRRASFEGATGRDFGFLVPTPTKPALAEAPNVIFEGLRGAMRPKHEATWHIDWLPLLLSTIARSAKSEATAGVDIDAVRVLDRAQVAGYDAVVLDADDATALTRWLGDHGYDARPAITDWVKPYVALHWKITAFKYAATTVATTPTNVGTAAVRLSFETDRPIFPYRVPSDQLAKPNTNHLLRVFFASEARFDGSLEGASSSWPGQPVYANRIDELPGVLSGAAPPESLERANWLTVFDDWTWPSGRADLYFERAQDQSPLVPTVYHDRSIPVPADVIAAAAGGGIWLGRRRRRKRAER